MYSRVTRGEAGCLRIDADAAVKGVPPGGCCRSCAPRPGAGVYVMVNGYREGMVMTLWADAQAMEASTPLASEAIEQFVTVFRAPPGRERYEAASRSSSRRRYPAGERCARSSASG